LWAEPRPLALVLALVRLVQPLALVRLVQPLALAAKALVRLVLRCYMPQPAAPPQLGRLPQIILFS